MNICEYNSITNRNYDNKNVYIAGNCRPYGDRRF